MEIHSEVTLAGEPMCVWTGNTERATDEKTMGLWATMKQAALHQGTPPGTYLAKMRVELQMTSEYSAASVWICMMAPNTSSWSAVQKIFLNIKPFRQQRKRACTALLGFLFKSSSASVIYGCQTTEIKSQINWHQLRINLKGSGFDPKWNVCMCVCCLFGASAPVVTQV